MPEPDGFFSTRWLTVALVDPREFGATREELRLALEKRTSSRGPRGSLCTFSRYFVARAPSVAE